MLLSLLATAVILAPQPFKTMNEAATHGLSQALKLTHQYEAGGAIYQDDGTHLYYITKPVTSNDPYGINNIPADDLNGYHEVANYHTHLCLTDEAYPATFSDADMQSYNALQIVGFIVNACTGEVKRIELPTTVAKLSIPPKPPHGTFTTVRSPQADDAMYSYQSVIDCTNLRFPIRFVSGSRETVMSCTEFVDRLFKVVRRAR